MDFIRKNISKKGYFLLDCIRVIFTYSYLMENFYLVNSHNLPENPLLFPTEITNLLFVIKNGQPLKQNSMLNCKKTMIKKKIKLITILFSLEDFHFK